MLRLHQYTDIPTISDAGVLAMAKANVGQEDVKRMVTAQAILAENQVQSAESKVHDALAKEEQARCRWETAKEEATRARILSSRDRGIRGVDVRSGLIQKNDAQQKALKALNVSKRRSARQKALLEKARAGEDKAKADAHALGQLGLSEEDITVVCSVFGFSVDNAEESAPD